MPLRAAAASMAVAVAVAVVALRVVSMVVEAEALGVSMVVGAEALRAEASPAVSAAAFRTRLVGGQ